MNQLTKQDARQIVIDAAINSLDSEESKRAYRYHLTEFLKWHTEQGQPPLTKSVIGAYKAHLLENKGIPAVNQALSAIKKMIAEAADNGMIDPILANGIANIKGVKYEALPAGRVIQSGELSAMIAACLDHTKMGARDAAMIALLYSCGLRRAELVRLDLADYEDGTLKIYGKGRKERLAHLVNGARRALEDWLLVRGTESGPLFCHIHRGDKLMLKRMTTQAVYFTLDKRAKQVGIKNISPHDFRRTFVSDLLDAGADIVTVQKMAGHADVSTTARYDRRPEEAKKKAAGLLHVPYNPL